MDPAVCYLLADPSGVIARVEVVPEGIDVCMQSDGMLAAVNFLQSEALEGLDRVPSPDNIVVRYRERIAAWYDQHNGSIDLAKLQSLCADNANGLCDHGETWDQPAGTIYSWTAELGTNRLQVADGRPCEVGYQATQLDIDLTSA